MKRIKSIVMAALVMLATATSVLTTLPASADNSSASLSIAPKKQYVIKPGQSVKDTLEISNLDDSASLQLSMQVVDFSYTDNSGTPKLLLKGEAQTPWSLKSFIDLPQTETIAPGKTVSVPMSISVPSNLGAGSYYSAIMYSAGNPSGGNVGLSASGVTLVFVTVPGKVKEGMQLKNLGAYTLPVPPQNQASNFSYFNVDEPLAIGYELQNEGNVFESPAGTITVKYMFGKTYTISNINPVGSLALIGQDRVFTACLKLQSQDVNLNGASAQTNTCTSPGLWPGYYSVELDAYYGQNGNQTQEVIGHAGFWYLPLWFIITAIVVLLLIAYFVWRITLTVRRWMGIQPAPKKPKASRSFRRK